MAKKIMSWDGDRNLVLKSLDEIKQLQRSQSEELIQCRIDIATLKVKSGLWGMLGALVPISIAAVVEFFISKGHN